MTRPWRLRCRQAVGNAMGTVAAGRRHPEQRPTDRGPADVLRVADNQIRDAHHPAPGVTNGVMTPSRRRTGGFSTPHDGMGCWHARLENEVSSPFGSAAA